MGGQYIDIAFAQARWLDPRSVQRTWGFTVRYSFRTHQTPFYLDRDYAIKPAYLALHEALGSG